MISLDAGPSINIIVKLKYTVEIRMEDKRIEELDKEWLKLVEELMKSNISKDEFRVFLELKRIEKENKEKGQ